MTKTYPTTRSKPIPDDDLRTLYTDMVGTFVGPVTVDEFFDELMPGEDVADPVNLDLTEARPVKGYDQTCDGLSRTLGHLFPSFRFGTTGMTQVNLDISRSLRPLGACYPKHVTRVKTTADDWQNIELLFYVSVEDEDPWDPNPNSAESQTDHLWRDRAQMAVYAKSVFSHQFRSCFFSFALYGTTARLFRWDRAGVVVTEAFDYLQEPELLAEFFQRYEALSPEERGWDTTAQPATACERRLFIQALKSYLADVRARKVPMLPNLLETLDYRHPMYKVRLDQSHCGEDFEVLVSRPVYELLSPVGRATQGRVAYHLSERRLIFLKDIWAEAVDDDSGLTEVDAYRYLSEVEMTHMPKTLYAGYVKSIDRRPQRTRTQEYCSTHNAWVARSWRLKERAHLRIAQDIAYPLRYVHSSRHLVQVIRGALVASQQASDKLHLMHCDISTGNIMLASNGEAVLNDWDHARFTDSNNHTPVGTRRYTSAAATNFDVRRKHIPDDDAESCVWILLDMCSQLRFEVDQLSKASAETIQFILKDYTGKNKLAFFQDDNLVIPQFESAPLNALIQEIRVLGRARLKSSSTAGNLHSELIKLMDKALARSDWPVADALHRASLPKSSPYATLDYAINSVDKEDIACMFRSDYHAIVPTFEEPVAPDTALLATTPATEESKSGTADSASPGASETSSKKAQKEENKFEKAHSPSVGSSATRVASVPSPDVKTQTRKRARDAEEDVSAAQTIKPSNSPPAKKQKLSSCP